MNLTEYLPHTFLFSNSLAVLYYSQTNQINSNSPVIVYISKGDITLKGTMLAHVADLVMSHTVKTEDKQEATTGRAFIFQSACQSRHSASSTAFL